jgi:hypothetical protein
MPTCGVFTLPEALEDVSEFGPLLTLACPSCIAELDAERRVEWALEDSCARHVDSDETLGVIR